MKKKDTEGCNETSAGPIQIVDYRWALVKISRVLGLNRRSGECCARKWKLSFELRGAAGSEQVEESADQYAAYRMVSSSPGWSS